MEIIYSKLNKKRILHIIHRLDDFNKIQKGDRNDIIDAQEFIQLSTLRMNNGQTFKPHQHIWKDGEKKVIAQESWVVIRGSVKCYFYDTDGALIGEPILNSGDCSITLAGGHTYSILEDDTLVYEYKTGPYKGSENDKIFIDEN